MYLEQCVKYIDGNYVAYQIGTFGLLMCGVLILMAIYFVCPYTWQRKEYFRRQRFNKIYRESSFSINTDFEYTPGPQKLQPLSILKPDPTIPRKTISPPEYVEENPRKSTLPRTDRSEVLRINDKRRESITNFQINEVPKINYPPNSHDRRYSSTENINKCQNREEFKQRKQVKIQFSSSVPDFNILRHDNATTKPPIEQKVSMNTPVVNRKKQEPHEITGQPVSADDIDDGQMQCTIQYDAFRSIVVIKDLQIKARFPDGIPGFLVEVYTSSHRSEARRSKVYVTVEQDVSTQLDEIFELKCTNENIKNNSIVFSIIPLLGNLILFAETELNELGLTHNSKVFLGGFLKGIFVNSTE